MPCTCHLPTYAESKHHFLPWLFPFAFFAPFLRLCGETQDPFRASTSGVRSTTSRCSCRRILRLPAPIVSVEIVNPIVWKEFEADKLSILDILAIDNADCRLNVEVQRTKSSWLPQRLTYYSATQDARLKWELDENTRIQTAFEEGEARGEARVRIELIRTLEELLRLQISSDAELRGKSLEELQQRAQFLQEMIRNRPSS